MAWASTITAIPNIGALIFFILSGFVIAHTLSVKSESSSYGLAAYGIERFSRIYTAFLPALLMIAGTDHLMQYLGHPLVGDPIDFRTLFGNLTMRQGLPSDWGVRHLAPRQLTSVAVEFHIYFFVGAIFFLLKGRNVWTCGMVAVLFSTMPLGYFSNMPGPDRALFAMWLAGFAAYYIAKPIKPNQSQSILSAVAFIILILYWARHRTSNDYDLSNYPALALAFLALVMLTQRTRLIGRTASRAIRFAADYSFSLFLIHLTIVKLVLIVPAPAPLRIAVAILAANGLAILFSLAFERHYKRVAESIKRVAFYSARMGKPGFALDEPARPE